jgi:hypothetical protein
MIHYGKKIETDFDFNSSLMKVIKLFSYQTRIVWSLWPKYSCLICFQRLKKIKLDLRTHEVLCNLSLDYKKGLSSNFEN